jgi:DNA-binding CsgD family transcriptional regulator
MSGAMRAGRKHGSFQFGVDDTFAQEAGMDPARKDRLVSSIYDAAVDCRGWNHALATLAEVSGYWGTSLEIFDRRSGGLRGYTTIDPEYLESFIAYWHTHFRFWGRTDGIPVGQIVTSSDLMDAEKIVRGAFYNEWLKPQGGGGDGRYANLVATDTATVMLAGLKSFADPMFSAEEERWFAFAVPHFIRAVRIQSRLRLAEADLRVAGSEESPAGFLVVDYSGRVLASHEPTLRRLHAAGLLDAFATRLQRDPSPRSARPAPWPAFGPFAADATIGTAPIELRDRAGTLLRIELLPVRPSEAMDDRWLAVDQPAALVHVSLPEEELRDRARRFLSDRGLTPAEIGIAIETSKGDGRGAVARRLGISEATVRSHLSTIFDKLGIHRQAELTRIVAEGSAASVLI